MQPNKPATRKYMNIYIDIYLTIMIDRRFKNIYIYGYDRAHPYLAYEFQYKYYLRLTLKNFKSLKFQILAFMSTI